MNNELINWNGINCWMKECFVAEYEINEAGIGLAERKNDFWRMKYEFWRLMKERRNY